MARTKAKKVESKKKASKKKASKKVASKKVESKKRGFSVEAGGYPLKNEEFLMWRLMEAEANAAKNEADKILLELQLLKIKTPGIIQKENDLIDAKRRFDDLRGKYMSFVTDICHEFGIDENKVCIDDELGILKILE